MKVFSGFLSLCALLALWGAAAPPVHADPTADVVFLVDESGSMSTEHAWIANMVSDLETALVGAGVGAGADANQYALVGFGTTLHGGGISQIPHKHSVGGADWGSASDLATASSGLVVSGGTEDGWRAIDFALNNYTFRAGAAKNFVLITDEDRDNTDASLSYASILSELTKNGVLLNAVVDATFSSMGVGLLGMDYNDNGYLADGMGGFTKVGGAMATGGFGTTIADYVNLATASNGAAWDLNQLRAGGLTAESFTNAFVSIKVQEIQKQLPEPGMIGLLFLAVGGVGLRRKLRKARA